MSVLIRGLRMPDGCGDCPFCSKPMYNKYGYAYYQCDAPAAEANGRDTTGKVLAMYCNGEKESFPNFCPLVEVPKHGRLIDADALIADLKRQCREVFRVDAVSPDDFWITRTEAYNERLWGTWCESFFDYLQTRPTIIPADEGE